MNGLIIIDLMPSNKKKHTSTLNQYNENQGITIKDSY